MSDYKTKYPFQCKHCNAGFSMLKYLTRHIRNNHPDKMVRY